MGKIKIDEQKLIELFNQNMMIKDIAQYFSCNLNSITRKLQKLGLKEGTSYKAPKVKEDPLKELKLQIKQLYLDGNSCPQIGQIVNLSEKTVSYHLKNMGVQKRSQKKINQTKFEELWNQGKTDSEIAEYFGVQETTIKTFRTKGKNAGKFNVQRYFAQTEQKLSYEQEQFILGSLLGDLSLTNPNSNRHTNSRLAIVQCEKQKELFMKKVEILGDFMGSYRFVIPPPDSRTGKIYSGYRGNSKSHKVFTDIYHLVYKSGVKTLTQEYLDKITSPLALAFWFMDDGSKDGILATNCFTIEEQDLLINWMHDKWNLKCHINKNSSNYVLRILSESRLEFEKLIFPYILPSMYYKLKYLDVLQAKSV